MMFNTYSRLYERALPHHIAASHSVTTPDRYYVIISFGFSNMPKVILIYSTDRIT